MLRKTAVVAFCLLASLNSFASEVCSSADLGISIGHEGVGRGTGVFEVVVENIGKSSCWLGPYPSILALNEKQRRESGFAVIKSPNPFGSDQQLPPPEKILLKRKARAAFQVSYSDGTGVDDQSRCHIYLLEIEMKRGKNLKIPGKTRTCGGIRVTPYRSSEK